MTFHEEGRKQLLRAREQEARLLKAQADVAHFISQDLLRIIRDGSRGFSHRDF